ncbi:MAG TPA: signal peptidase I [Lachnospiraceae bacterium]|nr:signal peptidase I [Lachnospiraceae bacterium]
MRANKKSSLLFRFLKKAIDIGLFILSVLVLTYLTVTYVAQRTIVHNVSMQETLSEGDNLIMDKISYHFREPKRFEIICFRCAGEKDDLIKRIIGLPGETVQIKNGEIFIDGELLTDTAGLQAPEFAGRAENMITLGSDEYFVLGDNRSESIDSRFDEVGNVRKSTIAGRAFFRIYPFDKFGLIN